MVEFRRGVPKPPRVPDCSVPIVPDCSVPIEWCECPWPQSNDFGPEICGRCKRPVGWSDDGIWTDEDGDDR